MPYVGTALSEVIGNIIPNQRINRIEKYLVVLAEELSYINEETLSESLKDKECVDLFEESFQHASRAITHERREYIAKIVKNGITNNEMEYLESKYIMKIISELNDQEIIWLRYYLVPTMGGDEEFRESNKKTLEPIHAYIGSDDNTLEKSALQKNYKVHLERLGLIYPIIKINPKTQSPKYSKFTGKPKTINYKITTFGKLILKQIGLFDS